MNNEILDRTSLLGGLNLNPIPLEFSQSMTTTKWLLSMDKKLSNIIDKVNVWYDTLLNDIDNNGLLYQHIINHLDSEFINEINQIQLELATFSEQFVTLIDNVEILSNVKPKIELSLNPTQSIYNVGETINSVVIDYNITLGNENITKVEVYKNDVLISTITQNIVNGVNTFVDGSVVNSDAEYKVVIYDKYNTIKSNSKKYYFVNDYYFGVANENTTINETFIKTLTSLKDVKQNLIKEFNSTNQKIIFAYPTTYGDLLEILHNDVDYIKSFDKNVILVDNINYNVYISNNLLTDIFDLEFNFEKGVETIQNNTITTIDGGIF